jgi:peptide/nickel transport system permease protein
MTDITVHSRGIAAAATEAEVESPGYWSNVGARLRRDPLTILCITILVVMLLAIVFAPLIAPFDPLQGSMVRRLKPPGFQNYWLGTDELGRDMLTRLLYGGRLSWFVGITPVVIATAIGGTLGMIAGFAGGKINMAIMRSTDVFYAFPSVLLAVAISGALGPGIYNAIMALTIVFIPPMIRVSESVTTSVRNLEFVEAARASGAGAPLILYATTLVSVSMILAAGLSFIGLGVKPPEAEWGLMLNTLRSAIYTQPLLATLPGICIFVTSICFNLTSDGLRTAMDVRN